MEQINYIKGKGLNTKSIDDLIVTCHFEVSKALYKKLDEYCDDVLTLKFTGEDLQDIELAASFNKDGNNWLSFQGTHGMIKLDIKVPSLLFVGYILTANIYITGLRK